MYFAAQYIFPIVKKETFAFCYTSVRTYLQKHVQYVLTLKAVSSSSLVTTFNPACAVCRRNAVRMSNSFMYANKCRTLFSVTGSATNTLPVFHDVKK